MTENKMKIPWLRIGAEGVVIVASILFAFAVDAWWAERQEREIEREDLERLHAEFIWNRDRVNDNGTATRAQDASAKIFDLVSNHLGKGEPLAIPNDLLQGIRGTPTFDPATPVLDGLVLSGRLSNVRDRDVLSAIALWQRHVTQVHETEIAAREFVNTQLHPAFFERGNMGPSFARSIGNTGVIVDEELVGLAGRRMRNTEFVLRALDRLRASANDVVLAVESALAE